MKIILSALLVLVALFGGTACQTRPRPDFAVNPKAQFAEYKSFAVAEIPWVLGTADSRDYSRFAEPMRSYVKAKLERSGFLAAPVESADLIFQIVGDVTYTFTAMPSSPTNPYRPDPWNKNYPMAHWYGALNSADIEKTGLLSVVAIDRKKNEVVWNAWTKSRYAPGISEKVLKVSIDAMLDTMPERASLGR